MWIKKSEYEKLKVSNVSRESLEHECREQRNEIRRLRIERNDLLEEVTRLKDIINAQIKDCKVGPWCKECIHRGEDQAHQDLQMDQCGFFYGFDPKLGHVFFCKKHLHELCPEFEGAMGSKMEGK